MPNGGIRIPRSRDSSSERIQIHMDSFRCTGCDQSVQTPQTFLGKLHGCEIFPDRPAEMIRAIIIEHMETYAVHSQLPEPLCQQFAVIFRQKTGSSRDVGPVKADRDSPHLSYRNHLFCSIFYLHLRKHLPLTRRSICFRCSSRFPDRVSYTDRRCRSDQTELGSASPSDFPDSRSCKTDTPMSPRAKAEQFSVFT